MTNSTRRTTNRFARGLLIALLSALALPATSVAGETTANPRIVKIHADWCGTCVRLNPTWDSLIEKYGDSVDFVLFDVTDDATSAKAQATAKELGLDAVLARYGGSTGQIVILPAASSEAVAVLKGKTNVDAYADPIAKARES